MSKSKKNQSKNQTQSDLAPSSERKGRSPKSARAAGLQFERDLANTLRHIFPEAERQLEVQASKCQGVDLEGTDIFDFQCKNRAGYCSVSTINEIKVQDPDRIPVLVTKGIRQEAMAVLPLKKFVTLLEVAYGLSPLLGLEYIKGEPRSLIEGEDFNVSSHEGARLLSHDELERLQSIEDISAADSMDDVSDVELKAFLAEQEAEASRPSLSQFI